MTAPPPLVQSILTRLKNEAQRSGRPFAELLELFAVERFLHRLGRSQHRDEFVLKGALLLRHWLGAQTRPTRDIDLLGPADLDPERLRKMLLSLVQLEVEADGIDFDLDSLTVHPIRAESPVLGLRARFDARLARVRLRYQIDVGLGDAVFPPATELVVDGLLGFAIASVRAYTPYTAVAEKLEAMVQLGLANTRFKDYFDLAMLPRSVGFDGPTLAESVHRTFARRGTPIPSGPVEGLSDAFAHDPLNATRWRAFLSKASLAAFSPDLAAVVYEIREFAEPVLSAATRGEPLTATWRPGGPWQPAGHHTVSQPR